MKPNLRFSPLLVVVGTVATLGAVMHPATAQLSNPNTSADPAQGLGRDTSSDLLSGGENGGISSMMDLIHRANMGEIPSSGEFQQDQRSRITTQAEQFRARQQELLRQQQQGSSAPALTPPSPANPTP